MSVFQYKAKAFGGGDSSSSSDDDVSDGEFERALERQKLADSEAKDKSRKGRKEARPAKTRAPAKKRRSVEDNDVEAFAPAIDVDADEPARASPPKKKGRKQPVVPSSSDDDDADEDTKRRLRMLRESRAAREAMRRAERTIEVADESDEAPVEKPVPRRRRAVVEEPIVPAAPKYGGALLKIKIRTEGDSKPLDYDVREDEPFAELFERYACDRGVQVYDCKFVFDGEVIGAGSKPRALDMESEDMVDCKAPARGKKRSRPGEGPAQPSPTKPASAKKAKPASAKKAAPPKKRSPRASPKVKPKERPKVVLVFDRGDGSKPKKFKIYADDEFRKVFDVYRTSVPGVSFSYLGAALNPKATPGDYGIAKQGVIDVNS